MSNPMAQSEPVEQRFGAPAQAQAPSAEVPTRQIDGTDVVEQGVAEGVFSTEHPRETIEILLTSAGMLLDAGIFTGEEAEIPRRAAGIARAAEALLGCEPGALAPIAQGASPEEAS